MNNSSNCHGNTSVYSASTGPSSVFSGDVGTYEREVREMEEYYMKTLLNEDGDAGSQASSVNSSPRAPFTFGLAQKPLFDRRALVRPEARGQAGKKELEVKINADYVPSSDLLPLTTENLVRLSLTDEKRRAAKECVHIRKTTHGGGSGGGSGSGSGSGSGEEVNRGLYKTELCESFTTKGSCRYGNKCQFAHGLPELKFRQFGNNFRTKPCINWTKLGYCPYGKRCCFKHGSDQDIKVYLRAGTYLADAEQESKKNLHANVRALQKMSW